MERALLVGRREEGALLKQIDNNGLQFVHLCFEVPKKPRSLKRQIFSQPTQEDDDDDDYTEENNVREPQLNKQRRTYDLEKKKKYDYQVGPSDLPEELKNVIERMKGTAVAMVAQKKLTAIDMDPNQNRLSVLRTKIRNEFLREE